MDNEEKTGPMQWGDHCIYLVCSLAELYKNAEFIDCELDTEGGLLKGHKVILAACSPYLKKLLLEHEGRRTVPLKQVKYKDMKYILDFIYNGEVGVPVAGMASLMETANFLKISSLRSCLSPNAFRKILSEVPVEQLVRCSGSENNIDLSKYCERNSPIEGDMKRCHKIIYSQKDDDLRIVSDHDKKSTDDLEQVSLRVNDEEMAADILKTEVIKENVMDEKNDNSQGVSHSTSSSPLSPASVKIKEDDISDSDDANLNVEEYSFGCDDTEENASEGRGRNLESESRMKIQKGKDIGVGEDIENLSENKVLETKSSGDEDPLAQNVSNKCRGAENVALSGIKKKKKEEEEQEESKHPEIITRGVTKYVVSLGPLSLLGINPSQQMKLVNGIDFNKMGGILYNSTSQPEKVLIMKKSSEEDKEEEEMELFSIPQAAPTSSSQLSSHADNDVSCLSMPTTESETEKTSTHTVKMHYLCGICESSFTSKTALNRHRGIHTGEKPYACDVCKKSFRMKRYLTAHMSFHTGEKPYVCTFCQAACRTKGRLNVHMRSHTGEKPYSCTMCGKSYSVKHHLARHVRVHTGEKPYQCNFCNRSFRDYAPLIIHKRTHTGERPYVCSTCGKAFAQKNSLNTHMLIHSDEKNHPCSSCHKSFKTKVQLQNHMLTHNGKKSFLCSTCGKAFLQKGTLNIHMQIHTGVKSYLCSMCGKSFLVPHQLKRHMQTHTGDKPHPCCICEKFFSDKGNLKAHMAIHTGAKHYRCCICDESFNRRSELKKHVVVHAEEDANK